MKFLFACALALCPLFSFGQLKQIAFAELTSGSGMFFGAQMSPTTITVTVKGPSDRFLGFGFGTSMSSGDAIIWSTLGTGAGPLTLRDHTMQGHQEPAVDAQQDWTVVSNDVVSGSRTIVATRALSTGDANDVTFNFSNTTQNLFWAHAQTASNQIAYHGSNKANGIVRNWVVVDQTPPTINATNPADNANGASLIANLTATFNESITFGTGSITLYDENDAVVQTVSNGSPGYSISGSTLTFNPSANLLVNTDYYIHIDPTAIKDLAGNPFAGITDNTTWNFNTNDLTAPALAAANALSPADNAVGVAVTANMTATFNENVQTGTGVIELFSGAGTLVESFDIASSALVTVSNATVTINPTADLIDNTDYYVNIAAGAIKDLSGNNYAGITSNTAWNFNTNTATPPSLAVNPFSPADNATGVALATPLTVTFSENIVLSTGTVKLFHSNGTLVESFNSASAALTVAGNMLTIDPTDPLLEMNSYYVTIDAGFITDAQANAYAGFSDDATWSFTAGDFTAPLLAVTAPFNPADNTINVAANTVLTVTFNEPVEFGTGMIRLVDEDGGSSSENFNVATGTGLDITGNTVSITPTSGLSMQVHYHVLIDATAITDLSGNAFAGISGVTTWNFQAFLESGLEELSNAGIVWDGTTLVLKNDLSANLYDAMGKTVRKNLSKSTDCSGLTTGIYFVGIQSENATKIFKIYVR